MKNARIWGESAVSDRSTALFPKNSTVKRAETAVPFREPRQPALSFVDSVEKWYLLSPHISYALL